MKVIQANARKIIRPQRIGFLLVLRLLALLLALARPRLELVDDVGLDPRRRAERQAHAQGNGKACHVDEGEGLRTELTHVLRVGEVGRVARQLREAKDGHRDGDAPKGPLPEYIRDYPREASVLDLTRRAARVDVSRGGVRAAT